MKHQKSPLLITLLLALGSSVAGADSVKTWGDWNAGTVGGTTLPQTIEAFNAIIENDQYVPENGGSDPDEDPVENQVNNFVDNADYQGYSALATYRIDSGECEKCLKSPIVSSASGTTGLFGAMMLDVRLTGEEGRPNGGQAVGGNLEHLSVFNNAAVGATNAVNGFSKNDDPTNFFGDYTAKGKESGILGAKGYISGNYRADNSVAPRDRKRRGNRYRIHNVTGEFMASEKDSNENSVLAFVGGTQTPTAFISALDIDEKRSIPEFMYIDEKTNHITASYYGESLVFDQSVSINVDFTDSSWSGDWGNMGPPGRLGRLRVPGFSASGDINGATIASNSVTGEGIAGGSVVGNFIGDQAQGLIGSTTVNDLDDNTFADVFNTDALGKRIIK